MVKMLLERFTMAVLSAMGVYVVVQWMPNLLSSNDNSQVILGLVLLVAVLVTVYTVFVDILRSEK